ncbi:H-2 class I histocompatibility antigen, Q10 alpha chain-like isoform X2, partial [Clarias magur]
MYKLVTDRPSLIASSVTYSGKTLRLCLLGKMEDFRAALKLLFFLAYVYLSSADTRSLQYLYTFTGQFTAVGLVDGQQVLYYDSNISRVIPKTEWMKKIEADDKRYWESETQYMTDQQDWFQIFVNRAKHGFDHNE